MICVKNPEKRQETLRQSRKSFMINQLRGSNGLRPAGCLLPGKEAGSRRFRVGSHLSAACGNCPGFALVTTLMLISVLLGLIVALSSYISLSQQKSMVEGNSLHAREAALAGLRVALGELQTTAGPDQRVTAAASLLGNAGNAYAGAAPAAPGRAAWTGVWKSNTVMAPDGEMARYTPADPDVKSFAGWLVSATDTSGNFGLPGSLGDATASYTLNDALPLVTNSDGSTYLEAGKVQLEDTAEGSRYFAFVVEDESMKADLSWSEASTSDLERAQAARLSAAPGPDYAVFNEKHPAHPVPDHEMPFFDTAATYKVAYPLTAEGGTNPFLTEAIGRMRDPADLQTLIDENALVTHEAWFDMSDWLRDQRAHFTWGSRGVLADVKLGGLRRDLSLAFEMDGEADISTSEQPVLFNQQVGEFVGGTDKYGSAHDYPLMRGSSTDYSMWRLPGPKTPVRARYLFRERWDTGGPFSGILNPSTGQPQFFKRTDTNDPSYVDRRDPSVARGPTWWNLRDYYNLYKRLEKNGTSYKLKARSYYPNRSDIGYVHSEMLDTIITWADHRDTDRRRPYQGPLGGQWKYVFRPARASCAPAFLGTTALLSVIATNYDPGTQTAEIAITVDPIFYFWNPYNRQLEVDNLMVHFETGMSGTVDIAVTDTASGTVTTYSPDLWQLLHCNFINYRNRRPNSWGANYGFLINASPGSGTAPFVLEPGEVIAASPSTISGQSYLGYDPLNNSSGIFMTSIDVAAYASPRWDVSGYRNKQVRASVARIDPDGDGIFECATKINVGFYDPTRSGAQSARFFMDSSLAPRGMTPAAFQTNPDVPGDQLQHTHMQLTAIRYEFVAPNSRVYNLPLELDTLVDTKSQFGLFTYLMKPTSWAGQVYHRRYRPAHYRHKGRNPVEVFSRMNPAPLVINKDWWAAAAPNMVFNFVANQNPNSLINGNGINFSTSARRAFWGRSCNSTGSTSVPMSNIPSSPLISLVDFGHANIGTMAEDQFHAVGNSLPSVVISSIAPHGIVNTGGGGQTSGTATDLSWMMNDALFDRYFLSGIAPEFDFGGTDGAYRQTGSLAVTLTDFYGDDPVSARASPVLAPHVPAGKTAAEIVSELTPGTTNHDIYKKIAAYSLIDGAFNVNSTSVEAWAALLRANRALAVDYAQGGGTDTASGSPFPSSASPSAPGSGARTYWSGFARLTDDQIWDDRLTPDDPSDDTGIAVELVKQVKIRGPFMSISDFINRKVGGDKNGDGTLDNSDVTNNHLRGALQAAVDSIRTVSGYLDRGIGGIVSAAGGVATAYNWLQPLATWYSWRSSFGADGTYGTADDVVPNSARGIPGDITQAKLLRSLAPRLTARGDTFRIRAYGEKRSSDDETIIARAVCEALVQRLPEYVDPGDPSDPENPPEDNEPWDEAGSGAPKFNETNKQFGRRFKIVQFRWLTSDEI